MSLGFSPGDVLMSLKCLIKVARILCKEAVESFKRCSKTYRSFTIVLEYFDRCVDGRNIPNSGPFLHIRRDFDRLLQAYSDRIKGFKPVLGRGRPRKSFKSIIPKFDWILHLKDLEELNKELEIRMSMLNFILLATGR